MILDKVLLAIVAAVGIGVLQNRLEVAQERHEKATKLRDIGVDRPLAIVARLPGHLDQFITYASHVRAAEETARAGRFTELQGSIDADIEGSLAFYADDQLQKTGDSVRGTVAKVKAQALTSGLSAQDINNLEQARRLGYGFHGRVVELSIKRVLEQVETAYGRRPTLSHRWNGTARVGRTDRPSGGRPP